MKKLLQFLFVFLSVQLNAQTIDTIVTIDTTITIDTTTIIDTLLIRHFLDATSDSMATHKIDSMTFDNDTTTNYNYTYTYDTTVTHDTIWGCSGGLTSLTYNGYTYDLVEIGGQCWFKENLRTTMYRDSTPIDYSGTDNTAWQYNTTGAYAWYDNDSSTNASIYGALYNWHAVDNSAGLCPTGWHVPSDAEWNQLVIYLDPSADTIGSIPSQAQSFSAGGAMKSTDTLYWISPDPGNPYTGATNASGFSGLPGGYRYYLGNFSNIGSFSYWWSSPGYGANYSWYRYLYYNGDGVFLNYGPKEHGLSVRCIRD